MMEQAWLRAKVEASRLLGLTRRRRHSAYIELFGPTDGRASAAADIVLGDLRDFCRARATTFEGDALTNALLEGRREVWLRIINQLHLTEAQIAALDDNRPMASEESDNG